MLLELALGQTITDGGCGYQKGGEPLKKIIFLLIIAFFLAGCTAEWYKHDTVYKTNDHMLFSWWGYDNPTDEDLAKSQSEEWWGDEVPYIPGE
jgi:hypothetical protein